MGKMLRTITYDFLQSPLLADICHTAQWNKKDISIKFSAVLVLYKKILIFSIKCQRGFFNRQNKELSLFFYNVTLLT